MSVNLSGDRTAIYFIHFLILNQSVRIFNVRLTGDWSQGHDIREDQEDAATRIIATLTDDPYNRTNVLLRCVMN